MFPFTTNLIPELIAVEKDPAVMRTQRLMMLANTKRVALDAEELRLIRLATDGNGRTSNDDMAAAQERLSVKKGTQTGWYLPEAHQARTEEHALRPAFHEAVAAAKARLTAAGLATMDPMVQELADLLREALAMALQIEKVCQAAGDGGVDKLEHPFPILLPGGLVEWQLDCAARKAAARASEALLVT